MTFKAPDKLPYDGWFDENPLKDSKYIDTPSYASCDISVHQQMARLQQHLLSLVLYMYKTLQNIVLLCLVLQMTTQFTLLDWDRQH